MIRAGQRVGDAEIKGAFAPRHPGTPVLLEEQGKEARHHRGGEGGIAPVIESQERTLRFLSCCVHSWAQNNTKRESALYSGPFTNQNKPMMGKAGTPLSWLQRIFVGPQK